MQKKHEPFVSIWHRLLPYVPFGLPLLFIYPLTSLDGVERYRAASVCVFGLFSLWMLVLPWRKPPLKHLPWQAVVTLVLIAVMILSSLLSGDILTSLFGINTDYQGLLVQLSALAIGFQAAKQSQKLTYWRWVSVVMGVVCSVSLLTDISYVLQSYRESGLILHATGMALYAAFSLGLQATFLVQKGLTKRWRWWHWYALACAVITLLFCASRIALLAALVVLASLWLVYRTHRKLLLAITIVTLVVCLGGSSLVPTGKRLTNPGRVELGVSYRLDLYRWSLQQSDPTLIGAGSSQIANVLAGHKHAAPPDIQKTLDDNFAFWYSHDQFIDAYIAYGIVGLALFVVLLGGSYRKVLRRIVKQPTASDAIILCLLVIISAHLLVNTPSVELACLVWLAIFSGYNYQKTKPGAKSKAVASQPKG